jgi:hypothetical protein
MDTKFFDSLYEGDSPNGVRLGMGLTNGDFWPRAVGCQMLYRGTKMDLIDFTSILTVAEADASEVSPPSYFSHTSGTIYFYIIRRANNCGCEEQTLAAAAKISIDASGELTEPQPNNIFVASAERVSGSKIQLVWYYCPVEQQLIPACCNVYFDAGTGQVDYGNPIATISYTGRRFYRYRSGALEADTYLFAIRIEDAAGVENVSLAQIRIGLDSTSPSPISILSVESV